MANDILVTPENLKTEADKLLKHNETLNSIFNQIASTVSGLISHWHGQTQEAFQQSFTQKKTNVFDKFSEDMATFAYFMKAYAGSMENKESDLKAKAANLG